MISLKSIKAGFRLKNPAFFRKWLKDVVKREGNISIGELQYIFCDDPYLLEINKSFLQHNTLTDIITFPSLSLNKNIISGEIYISIDRVKENMKIYNCTFDHELSRVMVHGLLHLVGYKDSSPEEKAVMREREEYYINLQPPKKP